MIVRLTMLGAVHEHVHRVTMEVLRRARGLRPDVELERVKAHLALIDKAQMPDIAAQPLQLLISEHVALALRGVVCRGAEGHPVEEAGEVVLRLLQAKLPRVCKQTISSHSDSVRLVSALVTKLKVDRHLLHNVERRRKRGATHTGSRRA